MAVDVVMETAYSAAALTVEMAEVSSGLSFFFAAAAEILSAKAHFLIHILEIGSYEPIFSCLGRY